MQPDDIDDLLANLGRAAPAPSDALVARVLADALDYQHEPARHAVRTPKPGFWRQVLGEVGGLPALAGLCSAAVVGLAIGYADPATVDLLTGGLIGSTLGEADLFPTPEFLATEG